MVAGMVVCSLWDRSSCGAKGVYADIGCARRRWAGLGQVDTVFEVGVVVQWRIAPSMKLLGQHKGYGQRHTLGMWVRKLPLYSVMAVDSRSLDTLAILATSEDLDDGFSLALAYW
ncbi:hypothetical protein Dimus_022853 [Dionaea muscipula]